MDRTATRTATSPGQSQQACHSCRKQKRKCDKRLPRCGTCSRSGRECEYSDDELSYLRDRVASLEAALQEQVVPSPASWDLVRTPSTTTRSMAHSGQRADTADMDLDFGSNVTFPSYAGDVQPGIGPPAACFFLDSPVFRQKASFLTTPLISVPQELLLELESTASVSNIADTYFITIHSWLPIVSKQRISRELRDTMLDPEPGLASLFIAMKVVCQTPKDHFDAATDPLYRLVKSYVTSLADNGLLSISVLQTSILLAVYEIGHGIYPAAYLSVGRCGRLVYMMGLHNKKGASPPHCPPRTWGGHEEMLRARCAVVVLERHINVGFESRPLSAGGFAEDEVLPCDTDSWDRGVPAPSLPLFVEAASRFTADSFARTCQVAHLLGRIIEHRDDQNLTGPPRYANAMQLLRTLNSLLQLLKKELDTKASSALNVAYAMVFSSKTVLLNMYTCTDTNMRSNSTEEIEMQAVSFDEFDTMVDEIVHFGNCLRLSQPSDLDQLSPLVCDSLYQAASTTVSYFHENQDEHMGQCLDILTELLRTIQTRWRVAGCYLHLIEIQKH